MILTKTLKHLRSTLMNSHRDLKSDGATSKREFFRCSLFLTQLQMDLKQIEKAIEDQLRYIGHQSISFSRILSPKNLEQLNIYLNEYGIFCTLLNLKKTYVFFGKDIQKGKIVVIQGSTATNRDKADSWGRDFYHIMKEWYLLKNKEEPKDNKTMAETKIPQEGSIKINDLTLEQRHTFCTEFSLGKHAGLRNSVLTHTGSRYVNWEDYGFDIWTSSKADRTYFVPAELEFLCLTKIDNDHGSQTSNGTSQRERGGIKGSGIRAQSVSSKVASGCRPNGNATSVEQSPVRLGKGSINSQRVSTRHH